MSKEGEDIVVTINRMIGAMALATRDVREYTRASSFRDALEGVMSPLSEGWSSAKDKRVTALETALEGNGIGTQEYKPIPTNREELEARFRENFKRYADDRSYDMERSPASDGTYGAADSFCQVAKAGAKAAGFNALAEEIERARKNMEQQFQEAGGSIAAQR